MDAPSHNHKIHVLLRSALNQVAIGAYIRKKKAAADEATLARRLLQENPDTAKLIIETTLMKKVHWKNCL